MIFTIDIYKTYELKTLIRLHCDSGNVTRPPQTIMKHVVLLVLRTSIIDSVSTVVKTHCLLSAAVRLMQGEDRGTEGG